jgi:DNA ligase-4
LTARASFEASHIAIVTAVNPSRAYAWTAVDTSVLTTFYLGVLANPDAVKSKQELPHYAILFRASYGPTRDQLEVYNENVRHGHWGSKPFDRDDPFKKRLIGLSWTYEIPQGMKPPSLLFERPMCAEVMGAGFQKLPGSEVSDLRVAYTKRK